MLWSFLFGTGADLSGGGRADGMPATGGLPFLPTPNAVSVMLAGVIRRRSNVSLLHESMPRHACG